MIARNSGSIPALWFGLLLASCNADERPAPAETSPNATIIPAPLLSGGSLVPAPLSSTDLENLGSTDLENADSARDRRIRGTMLEEEELSRVPAALNLHAAPPRDTAGRSGTALSLSAALDWAGPPASLRFVGLGAAEALEVNQSLRPRLNIELRAPGRMSIELLTDAFALPARSQFTSRFDAWGHLLVWPGRKRYRPLAQGAIRALLSEGRADVTPLQQAVVTNGKAGERLGQVTLRHELQSARGQLNIELVEVEGSGLGGPLLCRWLLELIGLQPAGTVCSPNRVPVWASIADKSGGELAFVVTELSKSGEPAQMIRVPPTRASFGKRGAPVHRGALLTNAQHRALSAGDAIATLVAENNTADGAFLVKDGVRMAFLRPHSKVRLGPFVPGDHRLGFRSFFGKGLRAENSVKLPATFQVKERQDAGAEAP